MITTAHSIAPAEAMTATVIDPLRDPIPPAWDEFATRHRLRPGWFAGPTRVIDWCVPVPSSMVLVEAPGHTGPVALFHARHFGVGNPARYVRPGRSTRLALTECRTVPVPMEPGFTFVDGLPHADRVAAVRAFERAIRDRLGPGHLGIAYRNLSSEHLALVTGPGRRLQRLRPRMVLDNQWSDAAEYWRSLPAKWRSQLKRIRAEVDADSSVKVELTTQIDPEEAAWLAEVIRQRYTPRFPPMPPLPAVAIAEVAQLPGTRFITYRERSGRLLGYSTLYDTGSELTLIWWGSRADGDGRRANLYFDQYLRAIELMIDLERPRMVLGAGMERIKARFGAHPITRWNVFAPFWTHPDGRPRDHAPTRGGDSRPSLPPAEPAGGARGPRRWWSTLRRWSGQDPERERMATPCRQCGRWDTVTLFRLSPRSARYWCGHCGALGQLRGRQALAEIRSREQWQAATAPRPTHPDSAIPDRTAAPDSAAAATGADPTEFMPPAMVRWIRSRFRRGLPPPYSKAVVYQRYREWDAHLRRLSPADVAALANPGEPPVQPGLPSFPQVVSALHNTCYDVERAVRQLLASGDPPAEEAAAALRERVEHARRWLARHARALCWVDRHPPEGLVEPDRAAVEAAVAALRSGALPDLETGRAALAALFGVDSSPSLSTLLRAYATDEVVDALAAYLARGERPLRQETLARLTVEVADPTQPDSQ